MVAICLQRKNQASGEDVERYLRIILQDLAKTLPSGLSPYIAVWQQSR
jgi:hypothetical protein